MHKCVFAEILSFLLTFRICVWCLCFVTFDHLMPTVEPRRWQLAIWLVRLYLLTENRLTKLDDCRCVWLCGKRKKASKSNKDTKNSYHDVFVLCAQTSVNRAWPEVCVDALRLNIFMSYQSIIYDGSIILFLFLMSKQSETWQECDIWRPTRRQWRREEVQYI